MNTTPIIIAIGTLLIVQAIVLILILRGQRKLNGTAEAIESKTKRMTEKLDLKSEARNLSERERISLRTFIESIRSIIVPGKGNVLWEYAPQLCQDLEERIDRIVDGSLQPLWPRKDVLFRLIVIYTKTVLEQTYTRDNKRHLEFEKEKPKLEAAYATLLKLNEQLRQKREGPFDLDKAFFDAAALLVRSETFVEGKFADYEGIPKVARIAGEPWEKPIREY
jgi:hypothetical protein